MAIDQRHQMAIRAATAELREASRARESLAAFVEAGLSRQAWPQPYSQAEADQRLIQTLRDVAEKLELAIKQVEIAEEALIGKLLEVQPFVCPANLKREIKSISDASRLARPGGCAKLLAVLSQLPISEGDRERLRCILERLESIERQGVVRFASDCASRSAYIGSPSWKLLRDATINKYQSLCTKVAGFLEQEAQLRTSSLSQLRDRHAPRLIAALPNPLATRLEALARCQSSVAAIATEASSYCSNEAGCDASLARLYERLLIVPEEVRRLASLPMVSLGADDIALAAEWANSSERKSFSQSAMRSARRAERGLLCAYADLYGMAKDLSIEQLSPDGDRRWLSADIETGGRLIDVKNARTSFSSPRSYSEHCVPRFKGQRESGEVVISGVLSPYVANEQPDPNPRHQATWLGEVTQSTLALLEHEFRAEYLESRLWNDRRESFLPPWLFEYPEAVYQVRKETLEQILATQRQWPRQELPIAAGVLTNGLRAASKCWPQVQEAEALQSRLTRIGVTRPGVFLHVLDRFCVSHLARVPFPADCLWSILFPTDDPATPLAMFDPLETISSLLATLRKAEPLLDGFKFKRFRLTAPGIFRGVGQDGRWQTIIAYCGGWKRAPSGGVVRCGKNPIALGEDHPCHFCGHLVCSCCGYCQSGCPGLNRLGGWREERSAQSDDA